MPKTRGGGPRRGVSSIRPRQERPTIDHDDRQNDVLLLEDLPRVEALEEAKTSRKRRRLPSPEIRFSIAQSSITLLPEEAGQPSTSGTSRLLDELLISPWNEEPPVVPSPGAFVTCSPASSIGSVPHTPKSSRGVLLPRSIISVTAASEAPENEIQLTAPSRAAPVRPMRDYEIQAALFDSDDDSEPEDIELPPVPYTHRSRQILFEDEDEEGEVESAPATINMEWEPEVEEHAITEPIPSTSVFGPDKFEFRWKKFDNDQIAPQARRETFKVSNCGPSHHMESPYDAFTNIWDQSIIEHIVVNTNLYAQQLSDRMMREGTLQPQSRITRWKDTNVDEIYCFFALLQAMGVVVKARLIDYWATDETIYRTPGFAKIMSLNRFKLLLKCIHFSDNSSHDRSKLSKIRPIINHLNTKFQSLYTPHQNLALDESLTLWKGWLNIKQFIRNKAAGVGVKTYEVCESNTGYLYRFEVHDGEHAPNVDETPVSGFIPALVLRLLEGLQEKGYTIFMDNYYNSPALARELKTRGFDCVGTLRANRQFVPQEYTKLKINDLALGEVRGCTSGDVDLVVWRDKKKLCLISSYHGLATVMDNRTETLKPSIIPDYNVCMGGVDCKDQMLSAYPIERTRSLIWYKKIFRRLLNVSVLNSYILYKHNHPIAQRKSREELINSLLLKHHPSKPFPDPNPIPNPDLPPHQPQIQELQICVPAKYAASGSAEAKQRQALRRVCKVCRASKTSTHCKTCNVAVCIFTCWEQHIKNVSQLN